MSAYDIDPDGVRTALLATVKSAQHMADTLTPLQGAIDDAVTACGLSVYINVALDDVRDAEYSRVTAMGERVEACVKGAAKATNAYVHHDQGMGHDIRHIQAAAVAKTRTLLK